MIENRYTYAKLKILRSLFAKRIKKPFHIMVFNEKKEKIAYDLEILSRASSKSYSKKHRNDYTHKYGRIGFDNFFVSKSTNLNGPPITLTYYLND